MKGDPGNPADWELLARRDYARSQKSLADEDPSACAFWLQQSAEKALKGWLVGNGWSLIKTHDLGRLLRECEACGLDLIEYIDTAERLSALYISDRYFDEASDPEPDRQECEALLAHVHRLFCALFPEPGATNPPTRPCEEWPRATDVQ